MTEYKIDAQLFKHMVISAANYLEQNKKLLNDLNVFPVPDGDTGTNMSLTMISAAKHVNACDSDKVGILVDELSTGALKGARGNSSVILSQLFRGFALAINKNETYLSAKLFAETITAGVNAAYKAVMKPKEGTILTVAKAMSVEAENQIRQGSNLLALIDHVIEAGEAMLKRTPEMLPVLKEAGVVDAGGAGLIAVYKGFKMAIDGEEITTELDLSIPKVNKTAAASAMNDISTADIEFGYCTEFFITELEKGVTQESIDKLRDKLAEIGDSLVVVGSTDLVKIHVHTNVPGKALQYALRLGQLSNIKIENMREQHSSLADGVSSDVSEVETYENTKPIAMVAVAAGEGLKNIFLDFNVDVIVEGGQSMNPSIEDIRSAIAKAPSKNVIIFPNNKNIILAAQQAKELIDKNVIVIPSKSFPQGLSAVLAFDAEASFEDNEEAMTEAVNHVITGEITHAVRDTHVNGFDIKEGDMLGLIDGDIAICGNDEKQALNDLIEKMTKIGDSAIITIYYGEDVSQEDALEVEQMISAKFTDFDVEVYSGAQSIYNYIVAVE